MKASWFVYIVRCKDGTLYTGTTTDVERRISEHNQGELGAKYTKVRRPVRLFYAEEAATRSSALQREYAIKQLSKMAKEALGKARQS